jgi:AcrR family transcriptional regulator
MTKKTRKQTILEAALHCFNADGIDATTIEAIRERSGASVGSLYHHFGSKERIASALFVEGVTSHAQLLTSYLAPVETAEEGVRAVVHAYVDWVSAHREHARFLLRSRTSVVATEGEATLTAVNEENFRAIRARFKPWIASGAIRKLPVECYVPLLRGPAQDYARAFLGGHVRTDISALRDVFADAAWRALAP